jgi:hypothetical protein
MNDEQLLQALQADLGEPQGPPPEILYWRAELQAKRERQQRAMKPLAWAERLGWLGIAAAVGSTLPLIARLVR